MTVAVSWVGNGRQFTADIGSDTVTVVKYRGAGGTPSAAAADGSIEGATALTVTVNKTGIAMFVTLPAALDFTTTELGELVYVWGNFLASSLLANQNDVDGGFGICLSSGAPTTSNYSLFSFFGADNYSGGWKRMLLDPTKTRSAGAGTLTTSNITHIGVFANVGAATARFDNLLLDACDVGTGLKVTGTSTLGLIKELLANEATNSYGVITALNDSETAVELAGVLTLGDDSGTAVANITDEDSKLFIAEPLYYNAAVVAAAPLDFAALNVVGNGTGDTDLKFGQQVGTTQGRNGISVVGNTTYDVGLDTGDGAVESSDWFGCVLENLTGTLNQDGVHNFDGVSMSGCAGLSVANTNTLNNLTSVGSGQINLNASAKLANALIINNTATAAILTSNLNDITSGDITSDGSGHAVELTSVGAGSMTWDVITSGYNSGVTGSPVTPTSTGNEDLFVNVVSGTLTINVASGATVPSVKSAGATINIVAGLSELAFTLNPSITAYEWRIYTVTAKGSLTGAVEVAGEESATVDNQAYSYTHSAGVFYAIQILGHANDYVESVTYYDSSANDQDITLNLKIDINN